MITSWTLICEQCKRQFSTAFPESDNCPYCNYAAIKSMLRQEMSDQERIEAETFYGLQRVMDTDPDYAP